MLQNWTRWWESAAITALCGACCLWLSADGGRMSNAWCNTSVRAYLPVTKTHPWISGGCIGGWRLGSHFWHLHQLISEESGSFLSTVSDLISYLIFDILISRSRCVDIMSCTMTGTKERYKMLMKHSNEVVKQNFTSIKPTSLTAAVSFNFSGCVRAFKVISIMLGFS